jgi:hypothetical protein
VFARKLHIERMAHGLMQNLHDDPDATPLEKAKVMASIAATLNVLAKLTGQYELGKRVLRLPLWKRVEQELAVALRLHPAAAEAIAQRFAALDRDSQL